MEAGLAGFILAPAATVAVQVLWIHLVESPRRATAGASTVDELETGISHLRETISQSPEPVAPAAPAVQLTGFFHQPGLNQFGYYFAKTPIQVGNVKLRGLHLGAP